MVQSRRGQRASISNRAIQLQDQAQTGIRHLGRRLITQRHHRQPDTTIGLGPHQPQTLQSRTTTIGGDCADRAAVDTGCSSGIDGLKTNPAARSNRPRQPGLLVDPTDYGLPADLGPRRYCRGRRRRGCHVGTTIHTIDPGRTGHGHTIRRAAGTVNTQPIESRLRSRHRIGMNNPVRQGTRILDRGRVELDNPTPIVTRVVGLG